MNAVETVALAPGYRIPRIIRGGWQLAGDHGAVDRQRAIDAIAAFVDTGLNTVDGADIYAGVEDLYASTSLIADVNSSSLISETSGN